MSAPPNRGGPSQQLRAPYAPAPGGLDPRAIVDAVREGRRLLAEAGAADGPRPCPSCKAGTVLDATFCAGCGARLRFPCPRCEGPCRAGDGFCGGCGAALGDDVVAARVASLAEAEEKERRRRADAPLRAYASTRVLAERPVRHVVGERRDGGRDFVKIADEGLGRRLLENERWALETIGAHPGVVRLQDRREHDGQLVLVLEHLEPARLRFPVAIPRLLRLVEAVLDTLTHVHARGVVHCDLKPKHLAIKETDGGPDRVVLIDWNVAQAPGPSRFGAYTPLFAAPEQVVGDKVDARVDLYALGVILYLLFTHDRFPAVLEETREPEPLLDVLQAKKAMNRAYLTNQTVYAGKLAALQRSGPGRQLNLPQEHQQQLDAAPPASSALEQRRVLGAKLLFTTELQRTHDVNAEIRLTGMVLAIVQKATAVDPGDRYPDAAAMRTAVRAALAHVAGGA